MRIQGNTTAINAHRVLIVNTERESKTTEKLSSGYKINRSADDAAGLAISEKMRAQIRGLGMASKNIHDGVNLLRTAEGALQSACDIINRMRELAVQAASDTNETVIDRGALNMEYQQLKREIDEIASKTEFNGIKLLNGKYSKEVFAEFIELLTAHTGGIGHTAAIPVSGSATTLTSGFSLLDAVTVADWTSTTAPPTAPTAPTTPTTPTMPLTVTLTPPVGTGDLNPNHPVVSAPLYIEADGADVGTNTSNLRIRGTGARVDINNGTLEVDGTGGAYSNDTQVNTNTGAVSIVGHNSRIPGTNSGNVRINGNSARIGTNASGGAVDVIGNDARITGSNSGTVRISGNNAQILTNASGGVVNVTGDDAVINGTNAGTVRILGNDAQIVSNALGGAVDIIGDDSRITGSNSGNVRISGNGAQIQTNANGGAVDVTGNNARIIGTNSGNVRISGNGAQIQTNANGGAVDVTGNDARITGTNSGEVRISGTGAIVQTNANGGSVEISGGGTVGTNSSGGSVSVDGSGTITANSGDVLLTGATGTIGTNTGDVYTSTDTFTLTGSNSGRLKSRSQTVTIANNAANGKALITDAATVTIGSNAGGNVMDDAGEIAVTNTGSLTVTSNSGKISTNAAANTIVNNTAGGEFVVTGTGSIDLGAAVTNQGTIRIDSGVSVLGVGSIFGAGNTAQGHIQIAGGSGKLSNLTTRVGVSGTGTLDLSGGATEYVSVNSGRINANTSRVNVTTNSNRITVFAGGIADVATNNSRVDADSNSTANITTNSGSAYADKASTLNIGTNRGSVRLNAGSTATITSSTSAGNIQAHNNSTVNITNQNSGIVYLFGTSRANISRNGAGARLEVNSQASATVQTNDGYIRNLNTSSAPAVTVVSNTANGVIDNYGRMSVTSNAITENLRHHVYQDTGSPANGIDTSGIQTLVTGDVLPKDAQYLKVYVNGQTITLEAYWEEVLVSKCCLNADGTVNPNVNCEDKIFQLVFSGVTDDNGRITFDANDAYIVGGTQYGIRIDDSKNSIWPFELGGQAYPDVPYDNGNPYDTQNRSGFQLVYQATISQSVVYKEGTPLIIQSGANEGDSTNIWLGDLRTISIGNNTTGCSTFEICRCQTLSESKLTNHNFAARAITISNGALMQVTRLRAIIGAQQNRLEHKLHSVDISAENLQNSESIIRDADIARELARFTVDDILMKSATAMLAQANALPQTVLKLLK